MDVRQRARSIWSGGGSGRRAIIVILVLVAIAAVIWLAIALAHRSASGPAGGPGGRRGGRPATTVGVATATLADIPVTLDGLGTVTPTATVTVSPQVSGVITEVLFREGQMVRKGETLAVIDPRPLRMALLQAQGQLARDEAQLANARLLLARDRTLLAQDSIARQDVDTQAALTRQLEGTVTADRAAVGSAQLQLGFSRVTAPVSGRAGLRVVDVGNFINAGAAGGIVVITQVTPIDVEFTVPQDSVPQIQQQAARSRLPVTAFDRTRTVTLDQGFFSTLDNQIDTTTGTVRAKARFANAAGRLFPNQFVNIRMTLQTLNGVVTVPVTAVRTGGQGDFVWILNRDRTVTMRKVTRGPATATTTSITQGLQAGERVITEGGDRLTEGARVMLPGDRPMNGQRRGRHRGAGAGGGFGGYGGGGGGQGGGSQAGGEQGAGQAAPAGPASEAAPHARPPGPAAAPAPGQETQSAEPSPPGGGGQANGGGGPGGGGFTPSPEMRAARQAMMQACGADLQRLCAGQEGREAFMCLRQNADQASAGCQAAMAKMPRRPRPAGG